MTAWSVSWHHEALGIPAIWTGGNFGAGITVAVLDSGVVTAPGLDQTDFEYLDARGNAITAFDTSGHGTWCASLIASYLAGALGIAPHAKIVSMRVLETGTAIADVESALDYLIEKRPDVDVVSCSFVMGNAPDRVLERFRKLADSGRVVVAAAGNSDATQSTFPEKTLNAVTVAALDTDYQPIAGARTGSWIDLAAPGKELPVVYSAAGSIGYFSESSAAAAVVSGVVALALAAVEKSKRRQAAKAVEGLLKATARSLDAGAHAVGSGAIDPQALIDALRAL